MRRVTTVSGLLDAANRGDVDHYVAERRVRGQDEVWSPAERKLQEMNERGLVVWGDSLLDVKITDAGKAHLERYPLADARK